VIEPVSPDEVVLLATTYEDGRVLLVPCVPENGYFRVLVHEYTDSAAGLEAALISVARRAREAASVGGGNALICGEGAKSSSGLAAGVAPWTVDLTEPAIRVSFQALSVRLV